jgi:cytochrome c oxidase subunit 4
LAAIITDMREHIDSVKSYAFVFVALLALTGLTTMVAEVDLGPFNLAVALLIAVIKMLLVALFFMHLRHSPVLTKVVVCGGMLWLAILMVLSMADFVSRSWMSVPGK